MFTEQMTAAFYDAEDAKYRRFWDPEGSLHWGVFEREDQPFLDACQGWNRTMLAAARIDARSRVLDLGCGNGTVASFIARETGAEVVGVDISAIRIGHARRRVDAAGQRLSFQVGSATSLPFPDGDFSHVFSQAVLYHTHDRTRALREAARVLAPGGLLALDDLTTPRRPVSSLARRVVYDRLLFEPTFSREAYLGALEEAGFLVLQSRDLSSHLARSYQALAGRAESHAPALVAAYRAIPEVVAAGEVGWAFFLAQRVPEPLRWIYDTSDRRFSLEQKYDAWARRYDQDLGDSYAESPRRVVDLLAHHLPPGAAVLDVGAGTGLVAVEMARRGSWPVTGLDQSSGMLAQAQARGVYGRLVQGSLADAPALLGREAFDAITAVGVFTFAHASLAELAALLPALRPGGHLFLALRCDYLAQQEAAGWRPTDFGLQEVARLPYQIFGDEPMLALALKTSTTPWSV
jgi:ubiquinone/menaquinone biosynthesis C-methylase UbiE